MTPLVLLHPLGSDAGFWDHVRPLLGAGEVLALDLPGHGSAAAPAAGATIEDLTDEVVRVLAEHGAPRFDVVGVSLGGLVAQDLAGRHPDLVERLVLVDTVERYPAAMQQVWRDRAAVARRDGLAGLAEPMSQVWFTDGFRERHDPLVVSTRETFLAMSPEAYAVACEALEVADTTAAVARLRAPTLVVCGREDAPAFLAAAAWLAEHVEGAQVAWLEGRHAAVLEQPQAFAGLLLAFRAGRPTAVSSG